MFLSLSAIAVVFALLIEAVTCCDLSLRMLECRKLTISFKERLEESLLMIFS